MSQSQAAAEPQTEIKALLKGIRENVPRTPNDNSALAGLKTLIESIGQRLAEYQARVTNVDSQINEVARKTQTVVGIVSDVAKLTAQYQQLLQESGVLSTSANATAMKLDEDSKKLNADLFQKLDEILGMLNTVVDDENNPANNVRDQIIIQFKNAAGVTQGDSADAVKNKIIRNINSNDSLTRMLPAYNPTPADIAEFKSKVNSDINEALFAELKPIATRREQTLPPKQTAGHKTRAHKRSKKCAKTCKKCLRGGYRYTTTNSRAASNSITTSTKRRKHGKRSKQSKKVTSTSF